MKASFNPGQRAGSHGPGTLAGSFDGAKPRLFPTPSEARERVTALLRPLQVGSRSVRGFHGLLEGFLCFYGLFPVALPHPRIPLRDRISGAGVVGVLRRGRRR